MAKLQKPFGRQIAKLKDLAREKAGDGASNEKLVEVGNEVAMEQGYAHTFTAESFEGKKKPGQKPGRKKQLVGVESTNGHMGNAAAVGAGTEALFTIEEVKAVQKVIAAIGGEKARQLINALA